MCTVWPSALDLAAEVALARCMPPCVLPQVELREWCRDGQRPLNVPSAPHRTYKDEGWLSWADWLGFAPGAPPRNEFLPFEVSCNETKVNQEELN